MDTQLIDDYIDTRFESYKALLQRLVSCRTVLGNVQEGQQIVYRHLLQIGCDASIETVDLSTLAAHPEFAPGGRQTYADQANVRGEVVGVDPAEPPFVLNGHIDVVTPGPVEWWSFDPWNGELHEGRMYGRGSLDMKSGLVAGLMALDAIIHSGIALRRSIIFESVIEEECTGNGMLHARISTGPAAAAIILEPTNMTTWTATPGVVWFEVSVSGKPSYVGRSDQYVNAVELAADLITKLKAPMIEELNANFSYQAFEGNQSPLTMSVGMIQGGDWPSNVPLECRFTCRMSYPIDWNWNDVQSFIGQHLARACSGNEWFTSHPPKVTYPGFRAKGWDTNTDTELHSTLAKAHLRNTGSSLSFTAFPGTADARYFSSSESVAYYGPSGGNIHSPDEFVDLDSVRLVSKVLVDVILEWCE